MEFYQVTFNEYNRFYGDDGGSIEIKKGPTLYFYVAKVGNEYIDLVTHEVIEQEDDFHTGKTDLFFEAIQEIPGFYVTRQMSIIDSDENLKKSYIERLNSLRKPELKIDEVSYLENNIIAPLSWLNESKEYAPSRQYIFIYPHYEDKTCFLAYEEDGVIREFVSDYLFIPIDANAEPSESYLTYEKIKTVTLDEFIKLFRTLENEINFKGYLKTIKDNVVLGEKDKVEYMLSFKKQKSTDINNILGRN